MQEPFIFNLFKTFTLQVYQTSRESNVTDLKGFLGRFPFRILVELRGFPHKISVTVFWNKLQQSSVRYFKAKIIAICTPTQHNCTMNK